MEIKKGEKSNGKDKLNDSKKKLLKKCKSNGENSIQERRKWDCVVV